MYINTIIIEEIYLNLYLYTHIHLKKFVCVHVFSQKPENTGKHQDKRQ